jgi:hypothetical protein
LTGSGHIGRRLVLEIFELRLLIRREDVRNRFHGGFLKLPGGLLKLLDL